MITDITETKIFRENWDKNYKIKWKHFRFLLVEKQTDALWRETLWRVSQVRHVPHTLNEVIYIFVLKVIINGTKGFVYLGLDKDIRI